jgi:hypothetical protein
VISGIKKKGNTSKNDEKMICECHLIKKRPEEEGKEINRVDIHGHSPWHFSK